MLKIDQYTFKTSLLFTLFCLLMLIIIESFFTFLNELQDLGDSDSYQLTEMLLYILYDMPSRIYRMFPMALLLGTLLGFGQLASHNELTAIRTAGFSKVRTLRGAIYTTLILSFLVVCIGEFLIPPSHNLAMTASNKSSSSKGFWAIDGEYIVEVKSIENLILKNITVYEPHEGSLKKLIQAPYMELVNNRWMMPDLTEITFSNQNITTEALKNLTIDTHIDESALTALVNDPEYLSSRSLWRFIGYLDDNNLDSSEYRLAFWAKIFNPLTNISMILIAAPLVFAQQRRQGIGERILIGVILGLIIYLTTQMLGHFILLSGFPPLLGALFPTVLAIAIAYLLFKLLP